MRLNSALPEGRIALARILRLSKALFKALFEALLEQKALPRHY
jgi:hypothetical protein